MGCSSSQVFFRIGAAPDPSFFEDAPTSPDGPALQDSLESNNQMESLMEIYTKKGLPQKL